MVPVRALLEGLAATEKPTEPFPVPELPEVTVIQSALLTAVRLHNELEAVIVIVPVPPLLGND
jgi:hypothetical protein